MERTDQPFHAKDQESAKENIDFICHENVIYISCLHFYLYNFYFGNCHKLLMLDQEDFEGHMYLCRRYNHKIKERGEKKQTYLHCFYSGVFSTVVPRALWMTNQIWELICRSVFKSTFLSVFCYDASEYPLIASAVLKHVSSTTSKQCKESFLFHINNFQSHDSVKYHLKNQTGGRRRLIANGT